MTCARSRASSPSRTRHPRAESGQFLPPEAGGPGGLGRIEDVAVWLARWSGHAPAVRRPLVALFAGTHGVAERGISTDSAESAAQFVELCAAGGTPVNGACSAYDVGLKVFDLALHLPTGDITRDSALDERACAATMAFGMEAVAGGTDLLCVCGIGVGEETVAAAILAALNSGTGRHWSTGRTRMDAAIVEQRAAVIEEALALHREHLGDPLEALRRLGGREFAAIAGAVLAARMERVPVVLDGPAALAAAAVLHALDPSAIGHCMLAQQPIEPAFGEAAQKLGLAPLLDLQIEQGRGTAAAIAAGMVRAAAQIAATLADAGQGSAAG